MGRLSGEESGLAGKKKKKMRNGLDRREKRRREVKREMLKHDI